MEDALRYAVMVAVRSEHFPPELELLIHETENQNHFLLFNPVGERPIRIMGLSKENDARGSPNKNHQVERQVERQVECQVL